MTTRAHNCGLGGVEYGGIGVVTAGSGLTMRQYLFDGSRFKSVNPRLYLLAEDGMNYEVRSWPGRSSRVSWTCRGSGAANPAPYSAQATSAANRTRPASATSTPFSTGQNTYYGPGLILNTTEPSIHHVEEHHVRRPGTGSWAGDIGARVPASGTAQGTS